MTKIVIRKLSTSNSDPNRANWSLTIWKRVNDRFIYFGSLLNFSLAIALQSRFFQFPDIYHKLLVFREKKIEHWPKISKTSYVPVLISPKLNNLLKNPNALLIYFLIYSISKSEEQLISQAHKPKMQTPKLLPVAGICFEINSRFSLRYKFPMYFEFIYFEK